MAQGLQWRRRSQMKHGVYRDRELVAEVVQESTPEGPRWFAKALPSKALCAPGACDTFAQAAQALIDAVAAGDI